MPRCPLLHPDVPYQPEIQNLLVDVWTREHWLNHFEQSTPALVTMICAEHADPAAVLPRARAMEAEMLARYATMRADPSCFARGGVMELCRVREGLIQAHGFGDVYAPVKQRENAVAMELLPAVVEGVLRRAQASGLDGFDRALDLAIRGCFAGNLFDMGSQTTARMHAEGGLDFIHWRDTRFAPGRWSGCNHIAQLAGHLQRFTQTAPLGQVIVLVDNAGADIWLGVLPLVTLLSRRARGILLAANRLPALNDITAGELDALLPAAGAASPPVQALLDAGWIRVISTGNDLPLIDLANVEEGFARACEEALASGGPQNTLLILVGMGRSLESNWDAAFRCPAVHLAVVKDASVARSLGYGMLDCVCRFKPAGGPSAH